MGKVKRRRLILPTAALFCAALASTLLPAFGSIPDSLSLTAGSQIDLNFALPGNIRIEDTDAAVCLNENGRAVQLSAGDREGSANLIFRLLGIVPVKRVAVEVTGERILIPGGKSVGIAVKTEGLVVAGVSDITGGAGPARKAGIRSGDIITTVDGIDVYSAEDFTALLTAGKPVRLTVIRGGEARSVTLTPAGDPRDGTVRIGAWVRSGTAGVGTLTYIDPETMEFGALGHAIADADTGVTLPVAEGGLYNSRIAQINRGRRGAPGEIVGDFIMDAQQIGDVERNTDLGLFGSNYSEETDDLPYPEGLPAATRSQTHTGSAQILTTVGDRAEAFDCEIEHVEESNGQPMRSLVVRVTDPELIARTGGIVQGMSGSPIIQDGRLVGAVTHVFVNDPERGYGICIEDMLAASSEEVPAAA